MNNYHLLKYFQLQAILQDYLNTCQLLKCFGLLQLHICFWVNNFISMNLHNIQVNVMYTQYNTVYIVQTKFSYVHRNVLYVGSACTAICVVYVVQMNIMYVGFH